jgi:hypothetical protein
MLKLPAATHERQRLMMLIAKLLIIDLLKDFSGYGRACFNRQAFSSFFVSLFCPALDNVRPHLKQLGQGLDASPLTRGSIQPPFFLNEGPSWTYGYGYANKFDVQVITGRRNVCMIRA